MAEFIMKQEVARLGLDERFEIASAATSSEEVGNPVHRGTKRILDGLGIYCGEKRAVKLTAEDYERYDYIIGMESFNITNIRRIIRSDDLNKIHRLLDYTDNPRDIADPWFTGDFKATYEDICEGIGALLRTVTEDFSLNRETTGDRL